MAELCEQANRLRQENEHLQTQLDAGRAGQSREPLPPFSPSRLGKGKEVVVPYDIDLPADDELSSGNSPLPRRSPSSNAVEAHFRKRPPRRSSRSVSVARHQTRREPSRDQRPPMPAQQYVPDPTEGLPRLVTTIYPPFGATLTPQTVFAPVVWGPQDMLSTPLGQHILDYDPPPPPVAFPYHLLPCTTTPPIHMIICYIIIRQ